MARPRVAVLDVARSRAALAEIGLRVPDLGRAADLLAEGGRLAPRGRHAQAAAAVLRTHLRLVEIPAPYVRLLDRAQDAAWAVTGCEVWRTSLFDTRAVRIDPVAEVAALRSRLLRLTAVTATTSLEEQRVRWVPRQISVPVDPSLAAAAQEIYASTERRVVALEAYRGQVEECDREWRRLRAVEAVELNADRVTDLLADTGADPHRVDAMRQMAAESRAAVEGLRQALEVLGETTVNLRERP